MNAEFATIGEIGLSSNHRGMSPVGIIHCAEGTSRSWSHSCSEWSQRARRWPLSCLYSSSVSSGPSAFTKLSKSSLVAWSSFLRYW